MNFISWKIHLYPAHPYFPSQRHAVTPTRTKARRDDWFLIFSRFPKKIGKNGSLGTGWLASSTETDSIVYVASKDVLVKGFSVWNTIKPTEFMVSEWKVEFYNRLNGKLKSTESFKSKMYSENRRKKDILDMSIWARFCKSNKDRKSTFKWKSVKSHFLKVYIDNDQTNDKVVDFAIQNLKIFHSKFYVISIDIHILRHIDKRCTTDDPELDKPIQYRVFRRRQNKFV